MGRELYKTQPVFKSNCDRCFQILQPYLNTPLKDIIFPSVPSASSALNETQYAQPAIFTTEYALAQLFIHWGIKPEATIGHSIGEYVAATLAGVFSLEDALKLVVTRSQLMQQQTSGVMLSVALSANDVETRYIGSLRDELSLAVVNTSELCVISGTEDSIGKLENTLLNQGVACRRLKTSHGFHSYLMDGIIEPFTEAVKQVKLHPPQIPFISNITGTWITDTEATSPEYWGQQIRATVQFAKGIETITTDSSRILLEVGAGKTLTTLAKQINSQNTVLSSIPHIKQKPSFDKGDRAFILNTCGQLWLSGVKLNWTNFYTEKPYRLSLPTYPFEKKRYWVEAQAELLAINNSAAEKDKSTCDWFYLPSWSRDFPVSQIDSAELAQKTYTWLVFQDDLGVSNSIIEQLNNSLHQVITVSKGQQFTIHGNCNISIHPQKSDCYLQLFKHLTKQKVTPKKIVYFWGCDSLIEDNHQAEKIFIQLLFLVQALDKQQIENSLTIDLIVSNLFNIDGREIVAGDRSILLGITKVINQEYSQIALRLRDIELDPQADYLLSEILSTSDNSIVAYRGRYRWLPQYRPYSLESQEQSLLKQQGVYLIIGNITQGLGLVWAEYLAKEWQAKLVLIGKDTDRLKLNFAESSELITIKTNINSEVKVKEAIAITLQHFTKIDGVFFSTPMTNKNSASLIQEMNLSHWQYNYETKIKPLQILDKCLQDIQLNFVCVQSSLSSVLGGIGLAAYASTNSYLDTFVWQKNHKSNNKTPWFSINWDACQTEQNKTENTGIGASLQEYSLTPEEVGIATTTILSLTTGNQIVVSKGNLQTRIDRWINSATKQDNKVEKINNITQHSRPNLTQKYIAPRNETEQKIAAIWQ